MAFENITNKKFVDSTGAGHLWAKIKERYDSKLDRVISNDAAISVTDNNRIGIQISSEAGNMLELKATGNRGLYVAPVTAGNNDTYSIVQEQNNDFAAVYRLKKYANGEGQGENVGVAINIPKDMVVQSGTVETKSTIGEWGEAGTYIHLVLANSDNSNLYIPAGSLIEYVTSGSQYGDMVVVEIDSTTHEVTAYIEDDSITSDKLHPTLRQQLAQGATAVQEVVEGSANGTISVDGTSVPVHGLGTAAYANVGAFDEAGAAADVLGVDGDTASTMTVYGVKQYASDVYTAIQALTNAEIDNAISAVEANANGQGF